MKNRGRVWSVILVAVLVVAGLGSYIYSRNQSSVDVKPGGKPDDSYDVIVIGGEPEGVAAAVSAARNGAKTLLVERRDALGGLFTYGMLNFLDIPQGEDGNSVSRGIFAEWHQLVGGQSAFGIDEAKTAFQQLVEGEENLALLTETEVVKVNKANNRIDSVELVNESGNYKVVGKTFIDATQDADFAVMSGVPYFTGGEDIGIQDKRMSVTLMIVLKNVNWEGIKQTAELEKFGPAVVTDTVGWGFGDLYRVYQPVVENTRLRGLNIAKVNEEVFINALQIFGVDGLSEESKQEGIDRGKKEIENILEFLRAEFPGFENAEVSRFPTELYVRETRHILAEYQLPMIDVWTNKDHWDNIGYGAYPVDIQAQTPQDFGYVVADPKQYAIPFRSLVPKEVEGLLVVGRSSGYSSLAAGSARVVPTGMTTGEAAGVAATLANEERISFREMSENEELIEKLRETLAGQGSFVEHITTSYPYEGEWYDESIQTLINYGLVFGRYDNDLLVEETASTHSFMKIVKEGISRANPQFSRDFETIYNEVMTTEDKPLTRDEAVRILTSIFMDEPSGWEELVESGLISREVVTRLKSNQELVNKEMYVLAATIIEYIKQ